ncbi:hypothetical protein PVAP13_9KG249426 [Panicum virgatum]|uniref:Uncharacterized protein n=1 Tax=Panicum virgatum TaxID=38727 RepID=A0A8T0NJQ1_PANVG|nr:hypothetical protein PVAP13_9KG249426 [Panicum virgatum]
MQQGFDRSSQKTIVVDRGQAPAAGNAAGWAASIANASRATIAEGKWYSAGACAAPAALSVARLITGEADHILAAPPVSAAGSHPVLPANEPPLDPTRRRPTSRLWIPPAAGAAGQRAASVSHPAPLEAGRGRRRPTRRGSPRLFLASTRRRARGVGFEGAVIWKNRTPPYFPRQQKNRTSQNIAVPSSPTERPRFLVDGVSCCSRRRRPRNPNCCRRHRRGG